MSLENIFRVLSEDKIVKIIDDAYRVLENIGIVVKNKKIQKLLAVNGAIIKDDIIKIPRDIILNCLESAPKIFNFYDRDCKKYEARRGNTYLSTLSDAIEVLDSKNMEKRCATSNDLINLTIIADYLDEVTFASLQVVPSEEGGLLSQLDAMKIILQNTNKPLLLEPLDPFITETWIEIEALLKANINNYNSSSIVMVITTFSPLNFDDINSKKILIAAEKKIPILIAPCPIAGMTSPFTLAGTLVQSTAESLFELVVSQLINKGTPIFFGGAPTIMDIKTGSVTYAAPEFLLITTAFTEISNYLGLPSYIPGAHPDSEKLDFQTGIEMMMGFMAQISCKPTILTGIGSLNKTRIVSLEKLIIDAEIFRMVERIYQGIRVDKRYLAYNSLENIRKNKNFLMDPLTIVESRSGEHYIPELLNREINGKDAKDLFNRAKEKVSYIIKEHKPKINEKVINKLENFFIDKKKEIKKFVAQKE